MSRFVTTIELHIALARLLTFPPHGEFRTSGSQPLAVIDRYRAVVELIV
jgi:hypothetical protein